MSYRHRFFTPGNSVHVMNRGHNREQIFDDDVDCDIFLSAVRTACARHALEVHGFALMKNHFHLLVTPTTQIALSYAIRAFESKYCYYYNRKHDRSSSIWSGRYHHVPIESAWQWLVCLRYIELNPVRAGIVMDAAAFRWTSYRVHAEGSSVYPWLADHPVFERLARTSEDRQMIYRTICAAPLSDAELTVVRHRPVAELANKGEAPAMADLVNVTAG